jgi:hypothetical protein
LPDARKKSRTLGEKIHRLDLGLNGKSIDWPKDVLLCDLHLRIMKSYTFALEQSGELAGHSVPLLLLGLADLGLGHSALSSSPGFLPRLDWLLLCLRKKRG